MIGKSINASVANSTNGIERVIDRAINANAVDRICRASKRMTNLSIVRKQNQKSGKSTDFLFKLNVRQSNNNSCFSTMGNYNLC